MPIRHLRCLATLGTAGKNGHPAGEYRDDDGYGFHEVLVNSLEGFVPSCVLTISLSYLAEKAPGTWGFRIRSQCSPAR